MIFLSEYLLIFHFHGTLKRIIRSPRGKPDLFGGLSIEETKKACCFLSILRFGKGKYDFIKGFSFHLRQ